MNTDTAPRIPARPTTYNGIKMRSRLEARYAAWLDNIGASWTYEPRCFADQSGQYLPDFLIERVLVAGRTRQVYVEVKPTFDCVAVVLKRMEIIWASEPDAGLVFEAGEHENAGPVGVSRDNPPDLLSWHLGPRNQLCLSRPLPRSWVRP